jgi:hypothetical protein
MLRNQEDLTKLNEKDLVAVCSWCRKIRTPSGNWIDPGMGLVKHFDGQFTHTICDPCSNLYFPDFASEFNETYQQIEALIRSTTCGKAQTLINISDSTGFDTGEYFEDPEQVREYFKVEVEEGLYPGWSKKTGLKQADLDEMAGDVIHHQWHCVF